MSKTKPKKNDGYPFDTGDWAKWSNRKRLDWMINLRDKLRDDYKETLEIPDEQIEYLDGQVDTLREVLAIEESNPTTAPDFESKPPAEKIELVRAWLDDLSADDCRKALLVGWTEADIERMRADWDKWEREVREWQRRENARNILGFDPNKSAAPIKPDPEAAMKLHILMAYRSVDDTELKEAFERGDEEAVNRLFPAWVEQLEAKAERDPIFAKWFEEFRDDQEKLLRWDDVIGDQSD